MTRRIVIINEHAPTLDAREGIRKVPAHALRQGDVTSANGERVVSVQRANDNASHVDVILAKGGMRRYLQWHRDVMVGVAARDAGTPLNRAPYGVEGKWKVSFTSKKNGRLVVEEYDDAYGANTAYAMIKQGHPDAVLTGAKDGVGTPEEVAYGEGWHSTQRGSPYDEPALVAAWERGRKAKQQQSKMTSGYFRGEVRGKRFDPPRVRQQDAATSLTRATHPTKGAELTWHVTAATGARLGTIDQLPNGVFVSYVDGAPTQHPSLISALTRVRQASDVNTHGAHSRDFKSEKGYVARLIDVRTGGTLARSEPHISNGAGLKAWVQNEARKLINQGKRVKAEIGIEFFDPDLVHD